MRTDDFDSQWHFVPDHPEALPRFRRTNRAIILLFAVFVFGIFIGLIVSRTASEPVTATHFSPPPVQKARSLAPQHAPAPVPQSR
jgi:hypothetical protein